MHRQQRVRSVKPTVADMNRDLGSAATAFTTLLFQPPARVAALNRARLLCYASRNKCRLACTARLEKLP
jgi:hypothetical protein